MQFLWLLLTALAALQAVNAAAQDITVRLIDARNGHVFSNETISVQFHVSTAAELQTLNGKTGPDGKAQFRLPEPAPPRVAIFAASDRLYTCYDLAPLDSQKIINKGVISRCSKPSQQCRCKFGKQISHIATSPAEVVLLARPMTWWAKVLGHFDVWGN